MVFFISSTKYQPMINKILTETDQACAGKEVGEDIFLKKFVKENLSMFENIELFIVDFTALADTDEEILQAIQSLRIMDYKTRCIVLAPYHKEGDKLLKEFFYAGIYDLITTDEYLLMSEQLTYCITEGMKYKDALKFRDAAEAEEVTETMAVQKILVGVAGASNRAGCTHMCITVANFLRNQKQMVALMEMNLSGAFESICNAYRGRVFEEGYFSVSGIDYYPNSDSKKVMSVSGKLYNFIVLDFGNYEAADKILFNRCDVRIVCSGVKPWETDRLQNIFEEQEEDVLKKYHFCFLCTTSHKLQKEISTEMDSLKNVWFPEYTEDPFESNRFPEGQNIFAEYLKAGGTEHTQRRRTLWTKKR